MKRYHFTLYRLVPSADLSDSQYNFCNFDLSFARTVTQTRMTPSLLLSFLLKPSIPYELKSDCKSSLEF